ncbi:MAG: hypothetical protein Ct9H300mP10_08910 [Methanobacteriota archaeon]|nr:MAG: hypothetical protein Ct9H300mP10_08910 [Euryarchaeota archaeon]
MHNPGGFTDGDRAACVVRSMGVPIEAITMLGTRTDFGRQVVGSDRPPDQDAKTPVDG